MTINFKTLYISFLNMKFNNIDYWQRRDIENKINAKYDDEKSQLVFDNPVYYVLYYVAMYGLTLSIIGIPFAIILYLVKHKYYQSYFDEIDKKNIEKDKRSRDLNTKIKKEVDSMCKGGSLYYKLTDNDVERYNFEYFHYHPGWVEADKLITKYIRSYIDENIRPDSDYVIEITYNVNNDFADIKAYVIHLVEYELVDRYQDINTTKCIYKSKLHSDKIAELYVPGLLDWMSKNYPLINIDMDRISFGKSFETSHKIN